MSLKRNASTTSLQLLTTAEGASFRLLILKLTFNFAIQFFFPYQPRLPNALYCNLDKLVGQDSLGKETSQIISLTQPLLC